MSIVRLGLSENQKCAEGYEAIFGKKKSAEKKDDAKTAKPKAGEKKKKGSRK